MRALVAATITLGLVLHALNVHAGDLPYEWEAASLHEYELADIMTGLKETEPFGSEGWLSTIAWYGGPEGVALLCSFLQNESPRARFAAAEELVGLAEWPCTHEAMLDPLLQALGKEQDIWA